MNNSLDKRISRHADWAFSFLEELIVAPSLIGHEQQALDVFAREALSIGLVVEKLPFPSGLLADPLASNAPPPTAISAGRFQVLASTSAKGPLHLLLNGHMDVVPADGDAAWTGPPFKPVRRNGRIYGRGAADMKCGFAVGLLAMRALTEEFPGLFQQRRLGFLAVVEEEWGGNGTLHAISNGVVAPEVIVLESTGLDVMTGGIGVLWVEVKIHSAAGHAQNLYAHGDAINLALRLTKNLRDWMAHISQSQGLPDPQGNVPTCSVNLGTLKSGDWISSVPSRALLGLRVGFPRGWSIRHAEQEIIAKIAALCTPEYGYSKPPNVRFPGFRAEGYALEGVPPLLADLSAAHAAAHGVEPRVFHVASTTDARHYINKAGVAAVCYGAAGQNFHGADENVETQSIVDAARTLARFIFQRFSSSQEAP